MMITGRPTMAAVKKGCMGEQHQEMKTILCRNVYFR